MAATANVHAAAGNINVTYHTKKEIVDFFDANPVHNLSAVYDITPSITSPYAAGKLKQEVLDDALTMLKRVRFVAGLSTDITLNDTYNEKAQAASMVNAANGTLSHSPSQPAGMDDSLYQLGASGAGSSNIAMGYSTLASAVLDAWTGDSDSSNIDRVGHRRWVLNPGMKQVGFGDTIGSYGSWSNMHYTAMYAFDNAFTRTGEVSVWPGQNTPVEYFPSETAWSYSTGSSENKNNIKVTLKNVTQNKTYEFSTASADGYFNVETSNYGLPGCVIFRPSDYASGLYKAGDAWQVTITGLSGGDVSYNVNFFSLAKPYQVSFLANGGSGTMAVSESLANQAAYILPACTFTAPNEKTFDHWELNGEAYQPGDEITVTDDISLKAVWESDIANALKFSGAALTLEDNLAIRFNVNASVIASCGVTDPYVVFEFNGKETTVSDYIDDGTGKFGFVLHNIAPQQMNDVVTATIYGKKDGVVVQGMTATYSVAQYCYKKLNGMTDANHGEIGTLLVDLLNYGEAAQIKMKYRTDALVTANLTNAQKGWATQTDGTFTSCSNPAYETIASPSVSWKGAGLFLEETVAIRYRFMADDYSGLTIKVTDESGHTWTYDMSSPEVKVAEEGGYYLYFNGLNAAQMREKVFAVAYRNSVAVSNTVCYSVESYVASKTGSSDTEMVTLIKNMMKYGDAAQAYVESR